MTRNARIQRIRAKRRRRVLARVRWHLPKRWRGLRVARNVHWRVRRKGRAFSAAAKAEAAAAIRALYAAVGVAGPD